MTRAILEVRNVWKRYGKLAAVAGASFTVEEGSIVGLIGPNGAGKTTLLDIISGVTRPDEGRIIFYRDGEGIDLTGRPIPEITRLGVARAFQIPNVFDGLTVLDNMRAALFASHRIYYKATKSYKAYHRIDEEAHRLLRLVGLSGKEDAPAGGLSHGERKLLDIAIALASRPRLLLLDEPTAGLSAVEKNTVVDIVRRLNSEGITILVVEHDLDVVFGVSRKVVAMHEGRVIAEGSPSEVRENPQLRIAYFGE